MPDYEYQKRIPINPTSIKNIIHNHGYYDINNNWNSIVEVVGYDGFIFRGRVEVILLRKDSMYMTLHNNDKKCTYRIPGGSFEKNSINIDQAKKEVLEETKIYSKNVKYTGVSYVKIFNKKDHYDNKKICWNGTYNEIFVAEYDSDYFGRIDNSVYDRNMYLYGDFYKIDKIKDLLIDQHKLVLQMLGLLD